jgi:hypothetical protein
MADEPRDDRLYTYATDEADVLVAANDAWDAFAKENAAPHLVRAKVLGQSLLTHITCPDTLEIYTLIFERVRREGETHHVPFRCDAPGLRRYMRMIIRPDEAGGLRFETRVDRLEAREACPLLDATRPRGEEFLLMCSWCKKLQLPAGEWVEVEEAMAGLQPFVQEHLPKLSHGMCEACDAELRRREGLPPRGQGRD